MLSEDKEGTAELVDSGIEARGVFDAAADREANMDIVAHVVRFEGTAQFIGESLVSGVTFVTEHVCAFAKPREVFVELEDAAFVKSQSFPNRVTILHRRIERANPGFVAMNESTVDVDDEIAIGGVVGLQHETNTLEAEFPVFKSRFCATVSEVTKTLASIEETFAFGREIANALAAGDVIALVGDLGAGKTHLTKGIVAGLGSSAEVTSPTFTLVHEYSDGRLPAYHFDFYRLDHPDELLAIGWDEYCEGDGVVIVEWADKFPELIPYEATWWTLRIERESRIATSTEPLS